MENHFQWQTLINGAFGLICFFGGWILKINFGLLSRMQDDYKQMHTESKSDIRSLMSDLTSLALSIPEKYVGKEDFNQLVKTVHHRFDRLEEKIDSLKESR